MNDSLNVLDELERRLIDSCYGEDDRRSRLLPRPLPRRTWIPAVAASAAVALVIAMVVAVLPGGEVSPAPALAALNRAARASERAPDVALTAGKRWYVKLLMTTAEPLPIPPGPGQSLPANPFANTVNVETHIVREVWMTRAGAMHARDVSRMSFASPQGAIRYGRKLQPPQTSSTNTAGHGLLSSPLLPVPLFSYRRLRALPTSVSGLLHVVDRIQAKLRRGARPARPAPQTTTTSHVTTTRHDGRVSITLTGTGTVVGRCCGSTPVQHSAVSDLNTIASLLAMPVSPQVRAALYRTAASLPGVRYDGIVRDSLGRRGVRIAVGSGDDQLRMIFNPQTGALLATSSGFGASALARGFGPVVYTIAAEKVVG